MRSGVVILLLILFSASFSYGQLSLTNEEKQWLAENPVIKVANEDDWPPFDYSEKGKALGLTISYVDLIAEKLGIKIQYINGHSWNELLAMSKNYELDVLPCLWYTKEREAFLNYTTPYISNPQIIVVNKKNKSVNKVEDLKGKKVAFIADYASRDKILEKFPEIIPVNVESPLEALLLVNLGNVTAYIDSLGMVSYQIDKHLLTGLSIAGRLEMDGVENLNNLHMGIRKDWPLLHSSFQKALNSISEEEKLELHEKWLMKIETDTKGDFQLLEAEKNWLASYQKIRFAYNQNLAPIEYTGLDNKLQGISSEYLQRISSKLEKEFDISSFENFSTSLKALKNKKVDIITTVLNKDDTSIIFTEPFLQVPAVILTHKNTALITNLETLKNEKVGFVELSGLDKKLQNEVQPGELIYFKDFAEGVKALENKQIFALCSDLATATYYLKKTKTDTVTIANTTDFTLDYTFAVRKDWEAMATILNRYLASVPDKEKNDIEHRWFNIFTEEKFSIADYWLQIVLAVVLVLAVILTFVFWNQKLAKEIVQRQKVEKSLEKARVEAEKSNQAKSDFLAMMSHEIRTPLNGIIGMSQLLSETPLTKDQQQQCNVIVSSGEGLLSIINDILDFSKIEAGKMHIDKHPFNLKEVIDSVVRLYQGTAEDKGLYLNSELDSKLFGSYKGDEGRLRQVILNLVSNAIKFTESGGVSIQVDQVESIKNTERFKITVKDTGIGISKEAQSKLFQHFTQADTSTTRKYGGTGLGLAISRKIVDLMNGSISINSEVGKGTEFIVEVLLPKSTVQVKTVVEELEYSDLNVDVKVLLVEDNAVNQKIAERVFTKLGCSVSLAENGLEALKMISEFVPDIIFMDCHMPEMDGYEATREIRKDEKFSEVPIIAMTANALQGDREKCLEAGMTDYLTKPFDKTKLINIVSKYTQKAS